MDKITDFFKEFKSRLTNPLFVSFIISWLILNWRIPVGIFGYKLEELKIDGYKSYSDLILKNASTWNYLWHPLIFALGYTIFFPVIRMFIIAFLSYIKKRSDNWNTEIMKDYYVPMNKFVKEKERYKELATQLQQIYTEDSKTIDENVKLKSEVLSLNSRVASDETKFQELTNENFLNKIDSQNLKDKIDLIERSITTSIITGRWQLNIAYQDQPENSYDVTIIGNELKLQEELWGYILMIQCDYDEKRISMAANLNDFVSLVLNGNPESRITMMTLEIKYTSEDMKIFSMIGLDSYGTSYNLKLID